SIFGIWILFVLLGTGFEFYQRWRVNVEQEDSTKQRQQGIMSKILLAFSLRRAIRKLIQMPQFGDYSDKLGFLHGMRVLSATWVILGHTYIMRDHLSNFALVRRYIRLIPSMMAVVGFLYLVPLITSGPLLNDMWLQLERPCTTHWWKVLTMTQNYMDDFTDIVSISRRLSSFS
ncbi:hypothetical protein ISCGN_014694, partial [Ixodes scapularis]